LLLAFLTYTTLLKARELTKKETKELAEKQVKLLVKEDIFEEKILGEENIFEMSPYIT